MTEAPTVMMDPDERRQLLLAAAERLRGVACANGRPAPVLPSPTEGVDPTDALRARFPGGQGGRH